MLASKKTTQNEHPLLQLANVGAAVYKDLQLLGIKTVEQLAHKDPDILYAQLQKITGVKQDPCVWDVFAAIIHEAKTGEKLPWWHWTPIRKNRKHS
jgi:hypothetical protein